MPLLLGVAGATMVVGNLFAIVGVGASEGYAVKTEPDAWSIVGGKLYLNYNATVRGKWSENKDERIERADKNWPEILKK